MKAVICPRYGPPSVLRLREIETPSPKDDEVLLRMRAASINSRDWRMLRANPFFIRFMLGGLFAPKYPILGVDAAGVVEAAGSKVTGLRPGDAVFGCLERYGGSTLAEYACASEDEIAPIPAGVTFEQAAAVPLAAVTALQGLVKGGIQAGQNVLIQGASGGVGIFAVQLAKHFGAQVTGVCSTRNLEMVRSLGADHVIDYKKEDFTRSGQRYDLILAVNGYHPINHYLRSLTPEGSYVVAGGSMRQLFEAAVKKSANGKKIGVVSMKPSHADLLLVKELLETGKLTPVIDRCYPLAKTADAFRYFEQEHPRGKVVITM